MEEKRSTEMCTCPFCGQIHMAEVDNPGDPKACEAAASMVCDCVGATNWRNRKRAIEDTQRQIAETFGPQGGEGQGLVGQETIALLQLLVPGLCIVLLLLALNLLGDALRERLDVRSGEVREL